MLRWSLLWPAESFRLAPVFFWIRSHQFIELFLLSVTIRYSRLTLYFCYPDTLESAISSRTYFVVVPVVCLFVLMGNGFEKPKFRYSCVLCPRDVIASWDSLWIKLSNVCFKNHEFVIPFSSRPRNLLFLPLVHTLPVRTLSPPNLSYIYSFAQSYNTHKIVSELCLYSYQQAFTK